MIIVQCAVLYALVPERLIYDEGSYFYFFSLHFLFPPELHFIFLNVFSLPRAPFLFPLQNYFGKCCVLFLTNDNVMPNF